MYANWIYPTVFVLLVACNNQPTTVSDRQKAAKREVMLDIGMPKDGKVNFEYTETIREAAMPGLDSLQAGYGSLQLRVWLSHSLAVESHIVIISLIDNEWSAKLITFSINNPEEPDILLHRYEKKVQNIYPRSGWNNFVNALQNFNIIKMPHSAQVPGCYHRGGADGMTYVFEVATPSRYRFYYYRDPSYKDSCTEASKILDFCHLLEQEFGFQYAD